MAVKCCAHSPGRRPKSVLDLDISPKVVLCSSIFDNGAAPRGLGQVEGGIKVGQAPRAVFLFYLWESTQMQNRHVPVDPTARCKISPLSCGCREAQKSSIPPQLSRGEILDTFGLDPEIAAVAAVPAIVRNEESGQLLFPAIVRKLSPGQFPSEIIKKL